MLLKKILTSHSDKCNDSKDLEKEILQILQKVVIFDFADKINITCGGGGGGVKFSFKNAIETRIGYWNFRFCHMKISNSMGLLIVICRNSMLRNYSLVLHT